MSVVRYFQGFKGWCIAVRSIDVSPSGQMRWQKSVLHKTNVISIKCPRMVDPHTHKHIQCSARCGPQFHRWAIARTQGHTVTNRL